TDLVSTSVLPGDCVFGRNGETVLTIYLSGGGGGGGGREQGKKHCLDTTFFQYSKNIMVSNILCNAIKHFM
ncbi:hypothetical protein ACJX0J_014721, partial [Zea mays]